MEYVEEVREVASRRLEKVEAEQECPAEKKRESLGEEQLLRDSVMLVDLALRRARASAVPDGELKDLVCEALQDAKQRLAWL